MSIEWVTAYAFCDSNGEAVAAAMEAGADFGYIGHKDADSIEGDGTFNVRDALEASGPFIVAKALREAAGKISSYDAAVLLNMADDLLWCAEKKRVHKDATR